VNATCPECGTPVVNSLDEQRLIFLNLGYLQRLFIGAILIPIGVLTTPFAVYGTVLLVIALLLILIATMLMLINPNDHLLQRQPIKWVAGLSVLTVLICWGYIISVITGRGDSNEYIVLTALYVGLAGFVTHLVSMTYWLSQLGLRSNSRLFLRTARILFGLVAVYLGVWAAFLTVGYLTEWEFIDPTQNFDTMTLITMALGASLILMPLALALLYAGTHAHFAWHMYKVIRLAKMLHVKSSEANP